MKPWQVVRSRVLLNREPWLKLTEQEVRLPGGATISGYLLAETREYAMTFAVTDDGRVPLVQQYKHGLQGPSNDLPAGYLEPGEEPLACAQRELLEETGLTAGDWLHLSSAVLDSNRGRSRAHLFLARDASCAARPQLDETEDLMTRYLAPEELVAMVRSGEIDSLASVACIMLAVNELES